MSEFKSKKNVLPTQLLCKDKSYSGPLDTQTITESEVIPFFKQYLNEKGYEVIKKDGRKLSKKEWKEVFRAYPEMIYYFLKQEKNVKLYRFGTFYWSQLAERSFIANDTHNWYPQKLTIRFKPGTEFKEISKQITKDYSDRCFK